MGIDDPAVFPVQNNFWGLATKKWSDQVLNYGQSFEKKTMWISCCCCKRCC